MSEDEKVVVFACPEFGAAEEARLQLKAAAEVLHRRAADAHAKGMYLEGQSVRIEQLADGCDDEDVIGVRDLFVREGLLEIERVAVEANAPGGQA